MAASVPSNPEPPAPGSVGPLVPGLLVVLSTSLAVIQTQNGKAPGDEPGRLLGLGCAMAFLAALFPRSSPVPIGLAALSGFPIGAAINLALRGGHNLLPFEFAFYAGYMAIGVGTATPGWLVSRAVRVTLR